MNKHWLSRTGREVLVSLKSKINLSMNTPTILGKTSHFIVYIIFYFFEKCKILFLFIDNALFQTSLNNSRY